ncbi:transporter substrate-binding domain-containing protein [Oscillospiraceae bacterium 38-13]
MKKLLPLLLALAMVLSLAACGSKDPGASAPADSQTTGTQPAETEEPGDSAAFTTVEEGKLHMSTNAAFPPYEMTTDAGGFEGIDVEVAQAIAEKLGLELVVDDMGFDAALLAAQNGQSDMVMAGVTVNEERLAVMDFSDSYATGVQVVIVKKGSPIATVDDLSNAEMIGCQKATTGYIYCSDDPENGGYGEDHVTAYETGALAVQALVNGQVDAVVIDNEPAKNYVAANEGLKILDTEFAVEDYAIGFAKGNTALLDAVNAAMAELKADGTFQDIVDKYITAE